MTELIAFFSRRGENYVNGTIRRLKEGNTEMLAKEIHRQTGADFFQIEPILAYSEDYSICLDEAKQDQRRNARPELKAWPEGMENYKIIYLGFPNYWGTMPMPVFTFLERFDFSEKIIRPFCTHEGSGFGKSIADIKRLCPGAVITEGLEIHGMAKVEHMERIHSWISKEERI